MSPASTRTSTPVGSSARRKPAPWSACISRCRSDMIWSFMRARIVARASLERAGGLKLADRPPLLPPRRGDPDPDGPQLALGEVDDRLVVGAARGREGRCVEGRAVGRAVEREGARVVGVRGLGVVERELAQLDHAREVDLVVVTKALALVGGPAGREV